MKASLHESGDWRVAFEKDYFHSNVDWQEDRLIDQWPRPAELAPGFTLAYRIIVPRAVATTPIESQADKKIHWIPSAPEGRAREIDVIITDSRRPVRGWPGKESMGTELVDDFQIASGERVWIVHHVTNAPNFDDAPKEIPIRLPKGTSKADILNADNLRMIIGGNMKDGSRVLYDCVLRVENQETSC